MVIAVLILLSTSILASGILWQHRRVLTLLAAAGVLTEIAWLLLTLLQRTFFTTTSASTVFMVGALLLAVPWVWHWRQWHWPYQTSGSGWRDVVIFLVLVPTLASAWLIQNANGFVGANWVAHSFYNGDSATLIALVQRSLHTTGLLHENPFAGNGPLEYPTLLHAGLAAGIAATGADYNWLHFLPLLVFIQIIITVPLFFLLRDVVKDVPGWQQGYRWGWRGLVLEAGVVGYVMTLSWESYVYPQGHFFTMALYICLIALLARAWALKNQHQYLWTLTAAVVTILLLLANAVTGVAAVAIWSVFAALRWADQTRSSAERSGYGLSIVLLGLFFLYATPGEGGLQLLPHFSYTAAQNMVMLAVPLLLVLGATIQQLRQQSLVGVVTVVLSLLAIVTFIFSDRNIIVDNASRFFYHAVLVGWPLLVDSIVRTARVLQARLRQLDSVVLRLGGAGACVVGVALLLLPAGASVASVHDHLLFKDVHTSNLGVRLGMEWITTNTDPAALFAAAPTEPWEIPLFTGRSLLRTNYWLSPNDALQDTVTRAFAGDSAAQQQVMKAADYILLKKDEQGQWNIPKEQQVYNFGGVSIYAMGS